MANRVGEQLDDYRLIRLLGAGTFGEVYLGEHIYQRTHVAVKVLNIHLTPDTLKDFLNEARTVRLKHPHIIQIVDFGISGDTPFLVMDYAPNGTLRQRHPQGTRVPLQRVLPYVRQVAAALQYAHDIRLIHRDVKPQNMLLGSNDQVLLSDFGIAVVAHTERSLTTQEMAGTVPYMAPEQIRGKPRPASDQYALGIAVYEWLCGVRPFRGSQWEIIDQHMSAPPPSLKEFVPAIPLAVEEVILTALAKDPQQRFASIQAFANALEQASRPEAPRPPVSTPVPPSITPIANPNPKPPVTPIPVSSVPQSSLTSPSTPPPTTSANRDTIQFSSLAATSMPSTSRAGDGQSPPLPPVNNPFTSSDNMIARQPVAQAAQQKRGRLVYLALTTALQSVVQLWRQKLHPTLAIVLQPVVKAPQRGRSRLFYTTLALLVLLLMGMGGTGAFYAVGVQPFQPIRTLIMQAQGEVKSHPSLALEHLASAQKLLGAMPHNPLTDAQRSQVIPLLTSTVHQAIHSYNQHAAITPLCPASVPTAPINDGSTGTHAHLLAVMQAATGSSLLYALGQDGKLYQLKQLNGLNSLANPITSNLQVLDIAGDDARLAVLTKGNTTNNYFLYLLVSGKTGLPQATDLAGISAVNGENPVLVTGQGTDIYVVLASPPSATTTHAQIVGFTVGSNNMLNPNPTRTSFSLTGSIVSAAAFPNHMLFLLLANGSLVSLQVGSSNATLSPVLVPSPLAPPLAGSGTAFTATMPVPTPADAAAVTSAGPVPLQVASTADLAAESLSAAVVGGVPHLYLADTANRRVVDLSGSTNVLVPLAGTRSASKSLLFQTVQQYASASILGQMKGIAMDAKGMVLYALTQSNPPLVRLVSIAVNEQTSSSCE